MPEAAENKDKAQEKVTREGLLLGLRVVFRSIRPHRKEMAALTVISMLSAAAHGLSPYIIGRFFDTLNSASAGSLVYGMPLFAALIALWVTVQVASHAFDWKISTASQRISNAIWIEYMSKGFGYLLELPMSFHKKQKIGEIGDKVNRAAWALYEVTGQVIIGLAPQVLSIFAALGIAFYLNATLALFLVAGTLAYVLILVRCVRPLAEVQKQYWDKINDSFGDAYDSLGNAQAIKQSTAEAYEQGKIRGGFVEAIPFWIKMNRIWENLTFYQRITVLVTQSAILVVAAYSVRSGALSLGELIAFFAYATMVFEPFSIIARNWQTIQNGIINIQKVEEIMLMPSEPYEPFGSREFALRGDISFRGVSFEYDKSKTILSDISFEAKAGEVIALVGESGVGKSTLIDLIGAYNFPTEGEVLVDGIKTADLNLRNLRSQIAVVPQEVVLFNDTIRKNVRYGRFDAKDEDVEAAARKAHALEFIEKFQDKWEQKVGERGVKLSVGQKQRVAIARAILRDPKILILDEPTSALDAGSEKIITESLEELMRGKTTFIIAHRLSTVRKADKILVFKEGKIVESGTHQQLLKLQGGEYKRLYELQIGLHD